jgi:hypothetical protein
LREETKDWRRKRNETKRNEPVSKLLKVAEGERMLKYLEEGGKGLKTDEHISSAPTMRSRNVA